MAMQQIEFTFPDEAKTNEEPNTPAVDDTVEVELGAQPPAKKAKKDRGVDEPSILVEDGVEIEVIDDTPPKDRGKSKASAPPEDVTDEELAEYSERVRKRIKHLGRGYNDERRAKEQALRERAEIERYAKQLIDENTRLKADTDRSQNVLIEQAKKQVESELALAKQQYKDAYEAGDPDALLAAQEALTTAKIRADKVSGLKPKALQGKGFNVQGSTQVPPQQLSPVQSAPQPIEIDEKAQRWREENQWFGADDEMTALALGYHNKLVKSGVDPQSDEYYEKLNSRMRTIFPEAFDDLAEQDLVPKRKGMSASVVAPASRSTAPVKARLTQTQADAARRLGLPLAEYARQVAILNAKAKE